MRPLIRFRPRPRRAARGLLALASAALAVAAGAQSSCTVTPTDPLPVRYAWSTGYDGAIQPLFLSCKGDAPLLVRVSLGLENTVTTTSGVQRTMPGARAGTSLRYDLILPNGARWGDGTGGTKAATFTLTPASPNASVGARLVIPAGQTDASGTFGDVLTVTIDLP